MGRCLNKRTTAILSRFGRYIPRWYGLGLTMNVIGMLIGLAPGTVSSHFRRQGIQIKPGGRRLDSGKGSLHKRSGHWVFSSKDPVTGRHRHKLRSHTVWAAYHGRPVPKGCVVHHVNLDPADDRPENLLLMTNGAHSALHRRLEAMAAAALYGYQDKNSLAGQPALSASMF